MMPGLYACGIAINYAHRPEGRTVARATVGVSAGEARQFMVQRLRETTRRVVTDWRVWAGIAIYKIVENWALGKIDNYLEGRSGWAVDIILATTDRLPWITWALIPLVFIAIMIHAYRETRVDAATEKLGKECREMAQNLYLFLGERNQTEPTLSIAAMRAGKRDEYLDGQMKHTRETMNFFDQQFNAKALWLIDELGKRGISNQYIRSDIPNWNNPHGIKAIADFVGKSGEALLKGE